MTKNIFKQNKTNDEKRDKWTIYLFIFKCVYIVSYFPKNAC